MQVGSRDNQQNPRPGKDTTSNRSLDQAVTSSAGIRNREKGVADIVVRELKRAKTGVWGCIQAHEVWSSEEEANMCPGHFWICKFGTVPGSMICVEKKFEFQVCKWEEYKGTR